MGSYTVISYGTNKGRILCYEDNALYIINKLRTNSTGKEVRYIRCNVKKCKRHGKITEEALLLSGRSKHNHVVDESLGKINHAFAKLIEEVRTLNRRIRDLHTEMLRQVPIEIASELPWKRVKSTLKRARKAVLPACNNIESMIKLLETDARVKELFGTYRQEPLYRGSIKVNGRSSVIFAIEQHIRKLNYGFKMYCDGTFSVIPVGTKQLFVIMGEIEGTPRLIAYVLMEGRKYEDYLFLFKWLRDALNMNPGSMMADFEKATRKAAREVWPGCSIDGCMFHFCQAIKRKARSMEEVSAALKKEEARTVLRMYMRLCLLPLSKVDEGLKAIKQYSKQHRLGQALERFHEYFVETWMHNYTPADWNVQNRIRRTNNNLESFNSVLKTVIQRNPSAYSFLDSMQSIVYRLNNDYEHETKHNSQRESQSKFNQPLKDAIESLGTGAISVIEFLKLLSNV